MLKKVPHMQNKIKLHVKYVLNINSLQITCSSLEFLLILIKNAIKDDISDVISLYMVSLESLSNWKSEIAASRNKSGT